MYRALLVEDEPKMREGMKRIVSWEGYGFLLCGEAENGREGLQLIEKEKPDLVVTDVRMPVLSGLELMMEVSGRIDCQFIVISGYSEFDYVKGALKFGAVDYLLKPLDEEQLADALQRAKRRLDREALLPKSLPSHLSASGAVGDVIRYIKDKYPYNITIKDIAGQLYMHPIYLGQLFKKTTGVYFNDYVHQTRLEEAQRLLATTTKKIYEIGLDVGYKDIDYFVQQFKKRAGVTPSQYRSSVRGCMP
ncbi:response regulator transcription factor [Paenibacillus tarimensis]|uniref:response regulator transcription factor n=1 Tax=Paenibacillus tarimensis TaxID=416012 RepID=UPI001F328863|nr:response regulator [Paenibacillus tarimensis]MCF2946381.1 response regulator [Paenibacillus tarimensis]